MNLRQRNVWLGFFVAFFFVFFLGYLSSVQAESKDKPATLIAPQLMVPLPGLNFSDYPAERKGDKTGIPFLAAYISIFFKYLTGLSVIAAAIMIVYGGFRYILGTSMGDISRGKEIIKDAVIGLLLILGSYAILVTVNAELIVLKPLTVISIAREEAKWVYKNGDMSPIDHDRIGGTVSSAADQGSKLIVMPGEEPEVVLEGATTSFGKGCGVSSELKIPKERPCNTREECYKKFCVDKNGSLDLPGYPKQEDLKTFAYFPKTAREQIDQFGIAFVGSMGWFANMKKKIDDLKILSFGGGKGKRYYSQDGMGLLPGAHDALIKAGKIARQKGYFIIPMDMTRTMKFQVDAFCERVKPLIEKNQPGTGGLALPGGSSHQFGYGLDAVLAKINDDGTAQVVTTGGPVCEGVNQIDNAVAFGLENHTLFQQIMAAAGWKRLCSEMWHFDYKGVYESDCALCYFPPKFRSDMKRCVGKIKYCEDHPQEGACKELKKN